MKYCKKCALKVNTSGAQCPLCASDLYPAEDSIKDDAVPETIIGTDDETEKDLYPKNVEGPTYDLTLRIFLFLSVLSVSICALINILSYNGMLWSLIVAGGVGFLWAAVGYPIIAKKNIGHYVAVDAVCLCLFFIMTQFVTKTTGWSLDYVIPFMFMGATTMISLIILIKRMKWREYALYQFITIVLGILPVISVIAGLVESIWPSIVSAFYSFVTLLAMFIFVDKNYKNELIKRFHI